ncbi:LytR/AlgR family response regulator transcription factor [Spirosoma soli]|uniref:LytR/AlgR family response regulator transcription factor n=1 Tax=Spirosoma soli TaxID=1770529 RepID=A0ABW5MA19_9BACT
MIKLLNQPYPSEERPWHQLRKAAVIGLFVGLFLVAFQPFGLNSWETPNRFWKIMGFGLVSFIITAFNFLFWQRLFPKQFSDQHWTVGRQILLITFNILLIAIGNRLYLEWHLGEGEHGGLDWISMILVTFLVSVFPVTGLVLLRYITQLKKYSQAAGELRVHANSVSIYPKRVSVGDGKPDEIASNHESITLIADNDKDTITLPAQDLLCIESSDNYCTVVYLKNGQQAKPLLRSSLSRLESQINVPYIVRCHRSYIVNLDRVERVTGNAQGYKLHLLDGQLQVPVARRYNDTLVAELKAL